MFPKVTTVNIQKLHWKVCRKSAHLGLLMRFCNFQLVTSGVFAKVGHSKHTCSVSPRAAGPEKAPGKSFAILATARYPAPVKWYYLPTLLHEWLDFYGKCREIYHPWDWYPPWNQQFSPDKSKNLEDDPFLFEILPIFQEAFAVSFRACNSTTRHWIEYHGTILGTRLTIKLAQMDSAFPWLPATLQSAYPYWEPEFSQKFQGPKINSSTHWKRKKITTNHWSPSFNDRIDAALLRDFHQCVSVTTSGAEYKIHSSLKVHRI